jgi:hypothetical protein
MSLTSGRCGCLVPKTLTNEVITIFPNIVFATIVGMKLGIFPQEYWDQSWVVSTPNQKF